MQALYSLVIALFGLALRLGALFNSRAKLWTGGRRGLFDRIRADLETVPGERRSQTAWFHCASLGEFEQGRPLMEHLREAYPHSLIVVTFFSPSGYEIRKDTPVADFVWYLPLDTPGNARNFVRLVKPGMAFFVKYEFWYNLLAALKQADIPVFLVSGIFRPQQSFFKWYGGWMRKQLGNFTWFFLQNGDAKALLEKHGIKNFTVTGDTRFDRVTVIAAQPKEFPLVQKFCGSGQVMVCGSTWPQDDALILPLIVNRKIGLKYIIAPHEVHEERIASLIRTIRETPGMPVGQHAIVRLSELTNGNALKAKVLVVDSIGQLAHLYRYATFAYVGGGFGTGLHNILEPVSFSKPVLFGPEYRKFPEASDLVRLGGAASVKDAESMKAMVKRMITDTVHRRHMSDICGIYTDSNRGATRRTMDAIRSFGFLPRTFSPRESVSPAS